MKIFKKVFLILTLFGVATLSAQTIKQTSSDVKVTGTSTAHDWEMTGTGATFTATISGETITNAKFSFPAMNLKSGKKLMDKKTYNALKATEHPAITFTATTMNVGKGTAAGKLTIAGVTKNVSVPVNVIKNGTSYTIEATQDIKLSDFGMERPGMLGMRTGDDIQVSVKIIAN